MSDDDFLDEYAYAITAYDLTSDLSQVTGNPKEFSFAFNDLDETPPPATTPIPKLQSIDDITTQNKVATFQLIKSIRVQNHQVEILISCTDNKDKITGSSEGEILAGGQGKDILKGGCRRIPVPAPKCFRKNTG